jgi:glycosyltransferase involved in cell wall biosynthesis
LNIFLKNLDHSIDIIHYLDGEHTAQYLPLFYKKFHCRTRIIAMYHQPPDLLNILTRKDVIRKLDAAIVVSPEQIPYFKAIMEPEKIFLILHGIDTNYFKPGAQLKADGKFRCITVGHYLRDFKVLRSVAEKLSVYHDIEFTVVDSGKTGPQELGIEDLANVLVYRNSITDDELLKLYQQSQVLFLPLQQTTANNALLEGLSCGIPIVSTLLPSITAYVSEEQAFLIENNEVDQLADALLYLYKNPSERKKMGNASRKRAEELDWQRIAPLYEEVYSQMSHQ